MTKIIELILTEERMGLGEEDDPIKNLARLWQDRIIETIDGDLLKD